VAAFGEQVATEFGEQPAADVGLIVRRENALLCFSGEEGRGVAKENLHQRVGCGGFK
jgi:hypothetical protein